jgi:hypothetical protein
MLQGDSIVSNYQHAISSIYGWQRNNENSGNISHNDFHFNGFTEYILRTKLSMYGFTNIQRLEDCSWNLNLICEKQ